MEAILIPRSREEANNKLSVSDGQATDADLMAEEVAADEAAAAAEAEQADAPRALSTDTRRARR